MACYVRTLAEEARTKALLLDELVDGNIGLFNGAHCHIFAPAPITPAVTEQELLILHQSFTSKPNGSADLTLHSAVCLYHSDQSIPACHVCLVRA